MARTIAGRFTDRRAAQRAVVDLQAAGFDPAHITLSHPTFQPAFPPSHGRAINSTTGSVIGALALGAIGALIGWAAGAGIAGSHGGDWLIFTGVTIVGSVVGWVAGGLLFASIPAGDGNASSHRRYEEGSIVLRVRAGGYEAVARHILTRNGGKELRSGLRRLSVSPWRQPSVPSRGRTPVA